MIRTMGKVIGIIMAITILPILVLVVGPVVGLSLSAFGMICTAFLPVILIGVVIGWIARRRR